mmetsp:Transcript_31430/g.53043  ORF Transcript_31430/g.53043 Transcript_31430/m.53043 type:complete len:168 (+) Transcript_31430:57-560(+)|eukprot:CAMPEP_0174967580 /NCGR_PEP_ID=MMETSP0004_2-20121128/7662_1 /TAXON_ID=420556 /ORGANISM="Ochromonas sp., Strain CCMP1393" /LENGTH=167 /DNA_ID=CAMNT_0016216727 /DNA_START=40 /DNA_END=543 /DNA_ORIENTATION=-
MLLAKTSIVTLARSSQKSIFVRSFVSQTARAMNSSESSESYTEKQAKLGRPVSPHVTIYKFPITALSSITNRVTGVALSVGVTGIGALSLVGADVPTVMSALGNVTAIGTLAKFSVSFPLIYHYFGGLRHIVWDRMPEMLENAKVEQSSYVLIGTSAALSAGLALFV